MYTFYPLVAVVFASLGMLCLWVLERRIRNASHVDAGWSAGIGLLALGVIAVAPGDQLRLAIAVGLGGCWSIRLTTHLIRDRLMGRPEDGRYALLRKQWAPHAGFWFFWFFQLQAGFVVMFALPFWVIGGNEQPFGRLADYLGIGWFVVMWYLNVRADGQLAAWRADPANKGRTCRSGLWRFSRHPNYFFEFMLWWSWAWFGFGADHFWITVALPLFLLVLLLSVTGIPYNEKRSLESKGDDYRDYQRSVSAFIPWFPKKSSSSEVL